MSNILSILNEIQNDGGKHYKLDVMRKHQDNELLKQVFVMAYSPNIVYYIKDLPAPLNDDRSQRTIYQPLYDVLRILEEISHREITGSVAKTKLINAMSYMTSDDDEVIRRIVARDLRCGISENSINKVFPYLIPATPYMGAVGFDEKKARKLFANGGKCESDVKMDGRYVNTIFLLEERTFNMMSRQGKNSLINSKSLQEGVIEFIHTLESVGDRAQRQDYVLNGELMMEGVSRYEANGIIASLIKIGEKELDGDDVSKDKLKFCKEHTMTYEEACEKVYITIWDYLPYHIYAKGDTWKVPRHERLNTLIEAMEFFKQDKVRLIEHKIVSTYEDAIAHFNELVNRGEEGTILKSLLGFWEDKKPVHQIKMKLEMTVDMKIAGFNEGNGKYVGMLGSLICESSDGLVKADPYAFSDTQRQEIWDNKDKYLNTIVEVKCNGLSSDRDGNYSLLHPVFKTFRDDTTVDDLQSIKDNQDMVMGLK